MKSSRKKKLPPEVLDLLEVTDAMAEECPPCDHADTYHDGWCRDCELMKGYKKVKRAIVK